MTPQDAARALEIVARDLDLLVFRLERDPPALDTSALLAERRRLRNELDHLRERVEALARGLE